MRACATFISDASMAEPILKIAALDAYYGLSHVLHGVDLQVGRECVALMGRNGAGKTTLARAVLGLQPPRKQGSIRLFGTEVTGWPAHRIARLGVGYVPQGRRLFPSLTVEEHLRLTARTGPAGDRWSVEKVFELFPSLKERRRSFGDQISGGERSMLAIGRALITNPGCLVLDEPTEGLAPSVVENVAESLRMLSGEGVAVLLIEQNVKAAALAADQVYFMADGHIVHEEPGTEILSDEEALSRHLGVSA